MAAGGVSEQPIPPPPDQGKWDDAAEQFQIDLLKNVQASASVWSGIVGTLLGLFGTVAVVTGATDVTKLHGWQQFVVIAVTIVAGILGGIALICAAQAQSLPHVATGNWNGMAYRLYVIESADRARGQLEVARILAVVAAMLVFATGVFVLIATAGS